MSLCSTYDYLPLGSAGIGCLISWTFGITARYTALCSKGLKTGAFFSFGEKMSDAPSELKISTYLLSFKVSFRAFVPVSGLGFYELARLDSLCVGEILLVFVFWFVLARFFESISPLGSMSFETARAY